MRKIILSGLIFLLPSGVFAQESSAVVSGKVSGTFRIVDNERQSAKFQEYGKNPAGVPLEIEISNKKNGGFFEFKGRGVGESDQNYSLAAGSYGLYKATLAYGQIPHRFAYDGKTLYAGVGSGTLTLDDTMQASLESSTSAANLANRLKNTYFPGAVLVDLGITRKKTAAGVEVMVFDPINLKLELDNEKREGTRPFSGSFGFGNAEEIPEPVNYNTTGLKFTAEYAKKALYLNASYYLSTFNNNVDTLSWDNPCRLTDSTSSTAYSSSYQYGASKGLIDLYPNNSYSSLSFSGSLTDLPLKSRIWANAAMGWMRQNDALVPYTTNTSIKAGAANSPPFDASLAANLPQSKVDGKVDTGLVNIQLTSRPLKFMILKTGYRYYVYSNKTGQIEFPGSVRYDAVWEADPIKNLPDRYKRSTGKIDFGFDLPKSALLTLGYTTDMLLRTDREVGKAIDNAYKISLDVSPRSWLTLKTSYEKSRREGEYDYTVPFEETIKAGGNPSQLPWLRKYDEANRDRDRLQFTATANPVDPLTLTGSVITGRDNFMDSPFGLLEDKHNIYSVDLDYAASESLSLYAFYNQGSYNNSQKIRQWNAGGVGDPFTGDTTYTSNSNWNAENEDQTISYGGGLNAVVVPEKLNLDLNYSCSNTDGTIRFSSPTGTAANDNNPFTYVDFKEVDDTQLQALNGRLNYNIREEVILTLGYLWQRFNIADFDISGFENIPTTSAGAYNGDLLMGTYPKSYDAKTAYAKVSWSFSGGEVINSIHGSGPS